MSSDPFFSPQMAWLFALLTFFSAMQLCLFIRGVIRLVRQSHILSVALCGEQNVQFSEASRVVLCLEGPLFTRRFAALDYELSSADGTVVTGRPALFRTRTTGFSTVRMELRYYQIPRPGCYRLRVRGLGETAVTDSRLKMVFMRPHLARSIGYVIGIVLSAAIFITSLVFALLCFLPG